MNISKIAKERLELMNATEIESLNYEGVVYIKNNKVLRSGNKIATLNTSKKINDLWDEMMFSENIC